MVLLIDILLQIQSNSSEISRPSFSLIFGIVRESMNAFQIPLGTLTNNPFNL